MKSFFFSCLCYILKAAHHQLAITPSQCGDHTQQMTCHIESIIVILTRWGEGEHRGRCWKCTHDKRGQKFHLCSTVSALIVIKTKSEGISVGWVGGVGAVAVVKATGPNRTTQHRLKTRKWPTPCKTSPNERRRGGGWSHAGLQCFFHGGKIKLCHLSSLLHCPLPPFWCQSLLNSSTSHKNK